MSEMMLTVISGIAYLILAPVLGGLLAGIDRKISARMQRRVGPPIMQPFYDFFKLWDKQTVAVNSSQHFYVKGFLLFAVLSGLFFFTAGDLLLVIFTLTLASVCFVVAAYSSSSPYSQIGAERELLQTMAYEPMLLMTAFGFYLHCGSFQVQEIVKSPCMNFIYLPGIFIGLSFILLIKFRKSPFDLSMSHEVHQELIRGALTEISGRTLALIEIAHWYENIMLLGFIYLFFAWAAPWSPVLALALCALAYFSDILIDNCCSRVKWEHMLTSTWVISLAVGFANIAFLMYVR